MSKIITFIFALVLAVAACVVSASKSYNYDPAIAMEALFYCKIAYCPGSAIQAWTCDACSLHSGFQLNAVYQNPSLQSQAYSGYNPNTNRIVVAFRGSSNIQNWIDDLTFEKVPCQYCGSACPNCEVHEGFQTEWLGYATPILRDVQALMNQYPTASILIAGHSLGASCVVHCAAHMTLKFGTAIDIVPYGFGTPRVGNTAFSEFVSSQTGSRTQRIVHKKDPVPHVPPMDFGFLHSPHESWYNVGGTTSWMDCNDYPGHEDPNCSDSIIPIDILDHLEYLGHSTECNLNAAPTPMNISRGTLHKLRKWAMKDKIAAKQNNKK